MENTRKSSQEVQFLGCTSSRHQTVWCVGTADTCLQWVVYDEQELDVDVQPWAEGPVAGSLYPQPEELPQIETQGSVTSEVPTCASEQPSLLQTKLGLPGVTLLDFVWLTDGHFNLVLYLRCLKLVWFFEVLMHLVSFHLSLLKLRREMSCTWLHWVVHVQEGTYTVGYRVNNTCQIFAAVQ